MTNYFRTNFYKWGLRKIEHSVLGLVHFIIQGLFSCIIQCFCIVLNTFFFYSYMYCMTTVYHWKIGHQEREMVSNNIPHTITPPPTAWTVYKAGWIHAFMLFTPNSAYYPTFNYYQILVSLLWTVALRVAPGAVFCCCNPFVSNDWKSQQVII